jgi:hypothetical protein
MNITTETVTPKVAEAWLNANKSNRKLQEGMVEKYATDMRVGAWTTCPAPIVFYEDGDLADGQHRLWAIVESGTTQIFPVARGLSREAGLNIDTGRGRTLIDNARISKTDPDLSAALIATARAMEFGTIAIGRVISNSEILVIVERHRASAQFAASTVRRKTLLCGAVVTGAVGRAHAAGVPPDKLARFCDVLATGLYDNEGETAAVAARNYLMQKGAIASTSGLWRDTFLKMQNAVSYFAAGKKLTICRTVADEAYPLKKQRLKKAA